MDLITPESGLVFWTTISFLDPVIYSGQICMETHFGCGDRT